MASWLNQGVQFVLKNLVSQEQPSNKVLEVKQQGYSTKFIRKREEALVLFGPTGARDVDMKYEIILNVPYKEDAFSLYRTTNLLEADEKFDTFKNTIPGIITISKDLMNVTDMQRICDIIENNKQWTVGHLAAHLQLSEVALSNVLIDSCLNIHEPLTGKTPLHVAIQTGNKKVVQTLISRGADIKSMDSQGNNVYHYAATSTKEIIEYLKTLMPEDDKLLDARNKGGSTPLHLACFEDKPPCVEALLLAGANANIPNKGEKEKDDAPPHNRGLVADYLIKNPNTLIAADMKFGGTPLHWASSREVIETMCDMGCYVNSVNFTNRTPLHVMVSKGRLDCVVALLSCGASVNARDMIGNTPLHVAAKEQTNVSVLQALVIFQSSLHAVNAAGNTARHEVATCKESDDDTKDQRLWILHKVGAERCPPGKEGCTEGCKADGTFDGIDIVSTPKTTACQIERSIIEKLVSNSVMNNQNDGLRLLSLDGGGIKGLLLVQMLIAIEKTLNGVQLIDCFDWVAGTSTGGILALAMACRKSLLECQCIYFRLKDQVFKGKRPYNSEPLERMLQIILGEHKVMSEIENPKVLITGLLADRKPPELHLFRNYASALDVLKGTHHVPTMPSSSDEFHQPPTPTHQKLWEAARASGAAPTYFRSHGPFLDGGLVANNPTMDAMTEIHELNLALKAVGRESEVKPLGLVVSIGTGDPPLSKLTDIDVFRPDSLFDTMKIVRGLGALVPLLVDQATLASGRVIDRARSWCSSIGVPYFRYNPCLSEDVEMDEKDDKKLVNILWETQVYMHNNGEQLLQLANLLIRQNIKK